MLHPPLLGTPDFERPTLRRRERAVVFALAEAMFSEDGEVAPARLDVTVSEVEAYIGAASRPLRWGIRAVLFILRIAPILIFAAARSLDKLPVPERVAVLSRLERMRFAPLSLAFVAWRTVLAIVFYEDEGELAQIGYSNERHRYKRYLALARSGVTTKPALPPEADSGVRLRGDDDAATAVNDDARKEQGAA